MKNRILFIFTSLVCIATLFVSCSEEEPPTAVIEATVDGYTATFSASVTNANTYMWQFGDGNSSTLENPTHTYQVSGSFTVSLTVSGGGGEKTVTQAVEILPSVVEMLSGGPTASGGKTWVLTSEYTAGKEGGSVIDDAMWVLLPSEEDPLGVIGFGQEYDNEFTFYHDGTYEVDIVNDTALTATLFGVFGGEVELYTNENNLFGLNLSSYTAPESATWTLHDEDMVVDAITNPLGNEVPPPHGDQIITGRKWVSLSEGAYFGILDFPTTRQFVIKEITPDKMNVALLLCAYWADPMGSGSIPTYFVHLTFVAK